MTAYTADWVKTILKNGDHGPLCVIYGGEHRSQPPLGKVTVGDIVYPVTLMDGILYIMGSLTISNIVNADEYTIDVCREPFMWDSYTAEHKDTVTHVIPRTCAHHAATGDDGTTIAPRPLSAAKIMLIKLGPKPGAEQPLKMRNGSISINNFSGHFRRLSEESAAIFDEVINPEKNEN